MQKKKERNERIVIISPLLIIVMAVVCYLCIITALTPKRYDLSVGSVAPQTITAPRTIEDTATTDALRNAARSETKTVYKLDTQLVEKYSEGAGDFFADIRTLRSSANSIRVESGFNTAGVFGAEQWRQAVSATQMQTLLYDFAPALTNEQGYNLLSADESELLRLQDAILPKITTSLESGLEEGGLNAKLTIYRQELAATSIPAELKEIGGLALEEYLKPTFVPDERATGNARDSAAMEVDPVEIKRGEVVVSEGSVVTAEQYELLRALDLVRSDAAELKLYIGVGLYVLCLFTVYAVYLAIYCESTFSNRKSMLIISISVVLSILFALLSNMLNTYVSPAIIAVMLIALLVNEKPAVATNALVAFCLAVFAAGRSLGADGLAVAAASLVGGQTAIFLLRRNQNRGAIIISGVIAGVSSSLIIAAFNIIAAKTLVNTLISIAWIIGGNAVVAILVVGTLTVWEHLFDVATNARLNELLDINNPLLRQLMSEAPGTYHHSVMTAALAQSAAESIGANPLLCRAGAYYHDIGKLRRPLYFKENQKPNENIHDTLPAIESATTIIAHLKDGVNLLSRNKIPSAVIQIAHEHHGTTLAAYFYHKATQESGGKAVSQKLFRYPGARPSTKESVIVFLADSCEAAVRSLNNPSREDVEELVSRIIKEKIEDGQLSLAPLDFRDIALIQKSFLKAFAGIMHERIAYPQNAIEDKTEVAVPKNGIEAELD